MKHKFHPPTPPTPQLADFHSSLRDFAGAIYGTATFPLFAFAAARGRVQS
jgi:hypothetical protein